MYRTYDSPRVDAAVTAAGKHMETEHDWVRLALACVDQAGATERDQEKVIEVFQRIGLLGR